MHDLSSSQFCAVAAVRPSLVVSDKHRFAWWVSNRSVNEKRALSVWALCALVKSFKDLVSC
jgi:hypothetical protein